MDTQKKKILIVDDDELLLGIYASNFTENDFTVSTAKNGAEAWGMIQGGNVPDILFTGIAMPEMDGFELISKIKADPKFAHIPVAISSHRDLPEDEKKAQDFGVDDFIVQGKVTPIEVVRRIKMIFGLRDVVKISFDPRLLEGRELIKLLNKQQGTYINTHAEEESVLEISSERESGAFKIKLVR